MAKKKVDPPRGPGRPPDPNGPKEGRVVMRASKGWMEWLAEIKDRRKWETSYFIREMARVWAKHEKEKMPPDE